MGYVNGVETPKDAAQFMLNALGSALRSAQKAAEQKAGDTSELSEGLGAAAEALYSIWEGSEVGGTQCLLYPGPGNQSRLFNHDTGEWEGPC